MVDTEVIAIAGGSCCIYISILIMSFFIGSLSRLEPVTTPHLFDSQATLWIEEQSACYKNRDG